MFMCLWAGALAGWPQCLHICVSVGLPVCLYHVCTHAHMYVCVCVCLLCSVVFACMSTVCMGVSGVSVPLCECMLASVTVCVSTECTYVCMYVGVLDTGGQESGFGG